MACDVGDAAETHLLLASTPYAGALHAAGVLRDKMIRSMALDDVQASFAPKALAASHLQALVVCTPLEALGLFSSIASLSLSLFSLSLFFISLSLSPLQDAHCACTHARTRG